MYYITPVHLSIRLFISSYLQEAFVSSLPVSNVSKHKWIRGQEPQ